MEDDQIDLILNELARRYPLPIPSLPVNGYARGYRIALEDVRTAWRARLKAAPFDEFIERLKISAALPAAERETP